MRLISLSASSSDSVSSSSSSLNMCGVDERDADGEPGSETGLP